MCEMDLEPYAGPRWASNVFVDAYTPAMAVGDIYVNQKWATCAPVYWLNTGDSSSLVSISEEVIHECIQEDPIIKMTGSATNPGQAQEQSQPSETSSEKLL